MKIQKRNWFQGWIFLIVQVFCLLWVSKYPEKIEYYYSTGFYPWWDSIMRKFSTYFAFSIGDIFYGLVICALLVYVIRWKKTTALEKFYHLGSFLSCLFFIFQISWGLNYYRQSIAEKWNLNPEYTALELGEFTEKLIIKTNSIQLQITKNPQLKVVVPYAETTLLSMGTDGYRILEKIHPEINYGVCSVKSSLWKTPLSYMGFSGYLNPFTHEAQINTLLPNYTQGNVICHEMAHQTGIASESECNFIGFLAGFHHPDLYFQYSACSGALKYCMNALAYQNPEAFDRLKIKIHPGILENFEESKQFWNHYDTLIDKGFHLFYDHFLKVNQQKDGLKGYSKYIGLLIAYSKKQPLFITAHP